MGNFSSFGGGGGVGSKDDSSIVRSVALSRFSPSCYGDQHSKVLLSVPLRCGKLLN